jgi:uncharacterized protein
MTHVIYSNVRQTLQAAPINRDWIQGGKPEARGVRLFETSDRGDNVHEWECTAGRFNWYYGLDEIVYVLEGAAHIKDLKTGVSTEISAGSAVLFQRGSSTEWTVDHYIRKIAVNHIPISPKILALRKAWRGLKRLLGKHEPLQDGGLGGLSTGDESAPT